MRRRELLRGLAGCLLFANTVLAGIRTEEITWGEYKGVVGESFQAYFRPASELDFDNYTFIGTIHDVKFTPAGDISEIRKSYRDALSVNGKQETTES